MLFAAVTLTSHSNIFKATPLVKEATISLYQTLFGEEHKEYLEKHWGWMYKDIDERKEDYLRNAR
jgi:hypothetical protein